jgi:glycosyltransferase involved in cell wall biosynthesis
VDRSTDETAAICRRFRSNDPRIEIIEQRDRLGWCRNVNALLERVDTPLFFIYFHDDLILPQYCEMLRAALIGDPHAASAHCDVLDFGLKDNIVKGRSYTGTVAERLLSLWTSDHPGGVLRSLMRLDSVGADFRLPSDDHHGFTPGHYLQLQIIAAGTASYVPDTLYCRWIRKHGLTDTWKGLPYEVILQGRTADLDRVYAFIDRKVMDSEEREILKIAITLYNHRKMVAAARLHRKPQPNFRDLHPDVPELRLPAGLQRFGTEACDWFAEEIKRALKPRRAHSPRRLPRAENQTHREFIQRVLHLLRLTEPKRR